MKAEKGEIIYYSEKDNPFIYTTVFLGETSRSWLVGEEWRPNKLSKRNTVFFSKEDYEFHRWARRNRYAISRAVEHLRDNAILKQIADLIGYKERP